MSAINAALVESPKSPLDSEVRTPLSAKILIAVLLLLFAGLLYRLLFGDGSVQEVWRLHQKAEQQKQEIESLRSRNKALEAEVVDLKKGLEAIEERARSELGMIRDGEVFYQFIDRDENNGGDAQDTKAPLISTPSLDPDP